MTFSVVIPARDAARTIVSCLTAVRAGWRDVEIIVVDDGSTDATAAVAGAYATRVIRLDETAGASRARNIGAAAASGEVVVFVDADVIAPPDVWPTLQAHFSAADGPDAVQGIYAATCPHPNAASQYKNLYYHYSWTRRIKNPWLASAASFFLAIRASFFRRLGGFDEQIRTPTVEDADLGYRIVRHGGRVLLDPRVEVVHDRRYGFCQLLRYDLRLAAAKTRFMLRKVRGRDVAVLHPTDGWAVSTARAGEMAGWLTSLALVPMLLAVACTGTWAVAAALVGCVILLQARFLAFVTRVCGARMAGAIALVLFADLLAVDAGIAVGVVSFLCGKRY